MSQKKKPTKKPTRGRPKGAKSRTYQETISLPSACIKCGSTEKKVASNPIELTCRGIRPDGNRYNHVIIRKARCQSCGQWRAEKTYEFRE